MITPYQKLRTTTRTYIMSTNVLLNIEGLFHLIECKDLNYPVCKKKRMDIGLNYELNDGDIVYAEFKEATKGTPFREKKKKVRKYMLNCVIIILKYQKKFYHLKISNRGVVQIAGSEDENVVIFVIKYLWSIIHPTSLWTKKLDGDEYFTVYIFPVMCNTHFTLDFSLNREKFNFLINTKTDHISILETSYGYVGVNVKINSNLEQIEHVPIYKLICSFSSTQVPNWNLLESTYLEYLNTLSEKEKKKKLQKDRYDSFLVFHSGKIIMSGKLSLVNRIKSYETFMNMVRDFEREIKIAKLF